MSSSTGLEDEDEDEEIDDVQEEEEESATLATLVSYLLAAKRSLSCINSVWKANEIRASAQHALEESVAIGARTEYIRAGIEEELKILKQLRVTVEDITTAGQNDYFTVLKSVDAAESRLTKTMDELRSTVVEASFGKPHEEPKCLLDFVDDTNVDAPLSSIKCSIDSMNEYSQKISQAFQAFDQDIDTINTGLLSETITPSSGEEDFHAPIPSLVASLENHAQEVADLLQSLVKHFDLCVTAIKHTEGGGLAAESITGDLPSGVDLRNVAVNEHAEPISHEDYREMMAVLDKDALEVDEVVSEIHERVAKMETQYELVLLHRDRAIKFYKSTGQLFHLLESVSLKVPDYVARSQEFVDRWKEERSKIQSFKDDIEVLRGIYQDFSHAYDELILEVARRKAIQNRMEKIVQEAMTKVDKLYEDDLAARATFKREKGEFLPVDIWPGLTAPPRKYEIQANPSTEGVNIPDLGRRVIERAIYRLQTKEPS